MTVGRRLEWDWYPGVVPDNVVLEEGAYLESTYSLHLLRSRQPEAVRLGRGSSAYTGTMFDVGEGGRVHVGAFSLLNGVRLICDASIWIGDYCLVSWNVVFMDTTRLPRPIAGWREALRQASAAEPRRLPSLEPARPIRLGSNVWIGFEVCILPGVSIGEGSVVGARSVVMEDLPPYTVAAGNPARVIRELDRTNPGTDQGLDLQPRNLHGDVQG